MSGPRVQWSPQPLTALRSRYAAAVKRVIDQRDVAAGREITPSANPVHVFDREDGIRLIVSMERLLDGRTGTHISASSFQNARSLASIEKAIAAWREVSGDERTPELIGVTPGHIPHFFLERGN